MRELWLALSLLTFSGSYAWAQADKDPLEAFYANTWNIYTDSPDGVHHYYLNRDHTWRGTKSKGELIKSGTWRVEAGKVCFHKLIGPPEPDNKDDCFNLLGKKVGETWKMDFDTETEGVAILHKGREK
jgi:hypothetical protein